jgi:hypothetical protein
MNWDYIAGLFDGDGHCTILIKNRTEPGSFGVGVRLVIAVSGDGVEPLLEFLDIHNIQMYKQTIKNPFGESFYIMTASWDNIEKIINNILPCVYIKKPQLQIIKEAINYRKYLKSKKLLIKDNIKKFDLLRHSLHKYAKKGRKNIKKYDY